ncbi:tRNA lysidine(34) synthetase TilS [Desulfurispira natronophila]|uniref:tRNA(Ile)-lysidine synthase n=1 Tax=Desulfurispira natronophila TaxID=682562 RepID=A0A7W7Y575_9BACT|nr:tRNA lysidine(34) synthetase TilS [Desulfurispira natronophila]MBB5022310.1 tRNA(Ile)-lysidine synthetase-like protein [Desulfurispira natronophila]
MSGSDPELLPTFIKKLCAAYPDVENRRFVLGVSGGVDSMVLLDLFRRTQEVHPLRLVVAHVDHGTRQGSSAVDRQLVASVCLDYTLSFYACCLKPGQLTGNFQSSARNCRYRFFHQVGRDCFGDEPFVVVTAMSLDDQVEKVFMDILQGRSLLSSLGHPLPGAWRPLADLSKAQLYHYARQQAVQWREDSTNSQPDYLRNRVRLLLQQQLEPDFGFTTSQQRTLVHDLEAGFGWLNRQMNATYIRLVQSGELDGVALRAEDAFVQSQVAHRFLVENRLEPDGRKVEQFCYLLNSKGGTRYLDGGRGVEVVFAYDRIYCRPQRVEGNDAPDPLCIDGCGDYHFGDKSLRLHRSKKTERKWFPLGANLVIFPLTIRNRLAGDTLRLPCGSVKLKKFLIDRKVPRTERHRLVVVENAHGEIIFLEGFGPVSPVAGAADDGEYWIEITPH